MQDLIIPRDDNLIVPSHLLAGAFFGGKFLCEHRRKGRIIDTFEADNLVVDEGINYLLNAGIASNVGGGQVQIAPWYMGLMDNYTPVAGTTMAQLGVNEIIAYAELTRQEYTPDALATAKSLTNAAARCIFTINQNATVVYGIFMASSSTKSGTSGTALSAALFASSKTLDDTDELLVTYTFGGADDGV